MPETALLQNYLMLGGLLFGIGMIGFLVRRNVIVIFLCAEMMLQGVSVTLVAFGRYHHKRIPEKTLDAHLRAMEAYWQAVGDLAG